MKKRILSLLVMGAFIILQSNTNSIKHIEQTQTLPVNGTWIHREGNQEQVLLFVDGYYTQTTYNKIDKQFIDTRGGVFSISANSMQIDIEFDTKDKEQIGQTVNCDFSIQQNELTIQQQGKKTVYKKISDAIEPLTGVWAITGRMQEGKVVAIQRTGTRKTLKILCGTRFQWAAIDPGQKSFSGTGGGSYEFVNGKYTEHIEFFSRDSSRVGASLQFDGKIENGEWHHSGLSSKGDKIYEVWGRVMNSK